MKIPAELRERILIRHGEVRAEHVIETLVEDVTRLINDNVKLRIDVDRLAEHGPKWTHRCPEMGANNKGLSILIDECPSCGLEQP